TILDKLYEKNVFLYLFATKPFRSPNDGQRLSRFMIGGIIPKPVMPYDPRRKLMTLPLFKSVAHFFYTHWRRVNLQYLGDRIVVGVFFAIVPTTISTYISRQNYYDEVVNAYLQDLRQYLVTDKIAIEKGKSDLKIDLTKGAKELMHSKTTNTLVKLNENSAFLGWSDVPVLSKLAIFQNNNLRRRDILINVLRNSGLGFTSRTGEDPVDQTFLEGIEISDESTDSYINLTNSELSLAHLDNAIFIKVKLDGSFLNYAYLRNTFFNHSSLQNINLYGADLSGAIFQESILTGAKFTKTQLANTNFSKAEGITNEEIIAAEAFLCNTTMPDGAVKTVNCKNANLSNQDLSNQDLTNVPFDQANLTNTNFTNAKGITLDNLIKQEAILCNTTLPDGKKISKNCASADPPLIDAQ
ncbi:MAG: pentapeptide repeat-containing protein, partial [Synechocystis sp.]|nr:pentapeptide repeat-containing protein [Synechocystis sp.]